MKLKITRGLTLGSQQWQTDQPEEKGFVNRALLVGFCWWTGGQAHIFPHLEDPGIDVPSTCFFKRQLYTNMDFRKTKTLRCWNSASLILSLESKVEMYHLSINGRNNPQLVWVVLLGMSLIEKGMTISFHIE